MKKLLLVLSLALAGCETTPEQTYWDLTREPVPESDFERDSQCAWLRSEMARMETASQYAVGTTYALVWQAKARDNIAALQSRYSQIQCDVVRVEHNFPPSQSMAQCFAKCREITSLSEGECFERCK